MEINKIEKVTNFESFIKNLPKKRNFIFNEILLKPYYLDSDKFPKIQIYNSNEVIFKNNKINYFSTIVMVIFFVVLFFNNEKQDNYYIVIGCLIYIVSIVLFIKFKIHKLIIIRNNGFVIENDIFDWKEVYKFGLYIKYSSIRKSYCLYVFSFEKGIKKFELSGFHQNEIMKMMNFYKNK